MIRPRDQATEQAIRIPEEATAMLLINLFWIVRGAASLVNLRRFDHNSMYELAAQLSISVLKWHTNDQPFSLRNYVSLAFVSLALAFGLGDSLYRDAQE